MKSIFAFAAILANAATNALPRNALPRYNDQIYVVRQSNPFSAQGNGGYQFSYELSDGQKRDESGQNEYMGRSSDDSILRVRGSYEFVGDDGQTYTVNYVADENGFQPQGAHLPGNSYSQF